MWMPLGSMIVKRKNNFNLRHYNSGSGCDEELVITLSDREGWLVASGVLPPGWCKQASDV